jgi:hypothetical protein
VLKAVKLVNKCTHIVSPFCVCLCSLCRRVYIYILNHTMSEVLHPLVQMYLKIVIVYLTNWLDCWYIRLVYLTDWLDYWYIRLCSFLHASFIMMKILFMFLILVGLYINLCAYIYKRVHVCNVKCIYWRHIIFE